MTIEELIKFVEGRRVHLSAVNRLELKFPHHPESFRKRSRITGKPFGLWWSCGGEWLEWCISEMPEWVHPFVYEVTPPNKLLKITTLGEYLAFNERYVPQGYMLGWYRMPDWEGAVRYDYDGIEIAPYRHERRLEDTWYYGWDCASGCAWGDASVKLIATREGDDWRVI